MRLDTIVRLKNNKNLKIRYACEKVSPDTYFDHLHSHDFCEICIVLSGDMLHIAKDKSYFLRPGDVFFCRPGDKHYAFCRGDSIYERFALWLPRSIFSEVTDDALPFMDDPLLREFNLFRVRKERRDALFALLEALKPLLLSEKGETHLVLYGKLAELVTFISAEAKQYTGRYANGEELPRRNLPGLVNHTIIYIRDNFANLNGVSEIAESLHIHRDHLSRTFKKHTGMTVHEYLLNVRINESRTMLLSGASVTETAFACGFNSTSYFIKVFTHANGMTPSKFKKSGYSILTENI